MTKYLPLGTHPQTRLRRMRSAHWSRAWAAESQLLCEHLILPVFVRDKDLTPHIPSLPGVQRLSLDELIPQCEKALALGIQTVALFAAVTSSRRTPNGEELLNPDGLLIRAIQSLKKHLPELGVITDVALDQFTSHGQDALVQNGLILNDETLPLLAQGAVLQAQAGADVIAPSEMMDGRVAVIRSALDHAGFENVLIMSYSAKYASSLYAPFRDALGSAQCLQSADKKTYQMDPRNGDEALREAAFDIQEGADMVMVKPGLPYLDVVYRLSQTLPVPICAYHVSGEYAMLKAAAANGWIDGDLVLIESLTAFRRAGAKVILTYGALEAALLLKTQL